MSAAPLLRHLVERSRDAAGGFGGPASSYLLVLDGDGLEDLPAAVHTAAGPWNVARANTEIGLRRTLWRANKAPLVVVVPRELALRLPADLVQGARHQRVQALETAEVLSVLLGRKVQASDEAWFNHLVLEHIEPLLQRLNQRTLPTVVSRADLGELLVEVTLSHEVRGRSAAQLLGVWVQQPPELKEGHRRLLQEALPRLHGDEGELLAWAIVKPKQDLERLMVRGLVLTVDAPTSHLPPRLWRSFGDDHTLAKAFHHDADRLRRTITRLATAAAEALGRDADQWLRAAEKLARDELPAHVLATSPVLPHAFKLKAHQLAQRAAHGTPILSNDLRELEGHLAAPLHTRDLKLLTWLARLSRALEHEVPDQPNTGGWADRYATDLAFADWAATELKRALGQLQSKDLHDPATQVLARWQQARDAVNLRFAQFLAEDWTHRLHDGVEPVHKISKNLLAPKLAKGERLFLVVLDGCSWPVFHELLAELVQEHRIGLTADTTRYGLALLPSITSHSRGAIFLGRVPHDPLLQESELRDAERTTDPGRFKQNPALTAFSKQLFLKGDLGTPGPLFDALEDNDLALVAAVFNAVDDQISSHNTHANLQVRVGDVHLLLPALERALASGRQVLVTADHGHTRYLEAAKGLGKGDGSRWTRIARDSDVPEGFLEIDTGDLGGSDGRMAFAWRMNSWLGRPQLGFHGGCSLEELVVPLVWLKRDGLEMLEPAWWHDLPHPTGASPAPEPPPKRLPEPEPEPPPKRPPASSQLGLLDRTDRLAALLSHVDDLGLPANARAALDDDALAVLVLLQQNERVSVHEIAARLDRQVGRIGGWMNRLLRKLDGHDAACFVQETAEDGAPRYVYTGDRRE